MNNSCALARSARMQQRLYDRYDALDEACRGLRGAIEALGDGNNPESGARYGADLAVMEEIAATLTRDRDAISEKLSRLEALDAEALRRSCERARL